MLIAGIVVVAVLLIAGAVVFFMVPEERRLRAADERARESRRAAAAGHGWRIIDSEWEAVQPDTVLRSMRGTGGSRVWMLARRRVDGVDIWAVCLEGMGLGAEVHRSIVVHLRPMRRAADLPAMRVIPCSSLMARVRRRDDPFDRRYRIVSGETARARALVTEEVRAQTLELDLESWQLQDRILTMRFRELRGPDALESRLSGLVRLAKQVAGPLAPPG